MAKADEGELHVGYSPTPVARMLPKVLRACQRAMPKVHIKLHDLANHENLHGCATADCNSHSWFVRQKQACSTDCVTKN